MNLKRCPKCDRMNTTRTAEKRGRMNLGYEMLLFNCVCGGTFVIMNRKDRERLDAEILERRRAS